MSNSKQIPWRIRDIVYVLSGMIFLFLAAKYTIAYFWDELPRGNSLVTLALIFTQWLTMLIPLYLFAIFRHKKAWNYFKLKEKVPIKKLLKYVFGGYLIYFTFAIIIALIAVSLDLHSIPGLEQQEPHIPAFGRGVFNLSIAFLVIVILAPIIEGVFFRGFILQTLLSRLGRGWGTLTTAGIFAFAHFEFQSILGLFALSLLINELFIRSKSILVVIAFHMANNAIAFSMEYLLDNNIISL